MKKAKILIGTDFSQQSSVAIEAGLSWAQYLNCGGIVINVNNTLENPEGALLLKREYESIVNELANALKVKLLDTLNQQIASFVDKYPLEDHYILYGKRNETILEEIKRLNAKLLVLGTHGHFNLENFFLGSTTDKAIRTAPCPVLAVKNSAACVPKKIMWLSDLTEMSRFTFEWVKILAHAFKSHIVVTHVVAPDLHSYEEREDLPSAIEQIFEQERSISKQELAVYKESLRQNGIDYSCCLEIAKQSRVAVTLLKMIKEQSPDLVILGTHGGQGIKKFFVGGVAEYLVRRVPCSFLVVRSE